MSDDTMPKEIWALHYESSMGHGEWHDYQPFAPGMGTKYIRADFVPQWQPIETAPNDGKTKALYGCFKEKKWYECISKRGNGVGGKHVNVPTGFRSYTGATHWMPLPKPPEKEK